MYLKTRIAGNDTRQNRIVEIILTISSVLVLIRIMYNRSPKLQIEHNGFLIVLDSNLMDVIICLIVFTL